MNCTSVGYYETGNSVYCYTKLIYPNLDENKYINTAYIFFSHLSYMYSELSQKKTL